jgi:DNA-binding PadR family transcriptional regulator
MSAGAAWGACEFGPGLSDLLESIRDMVGQVSSSAAAGKFKHGASAKAESRPHRGPWDRGFVGPRSGGHWGGGFVGPRGGWWPGPPGPPGPKASRGDVRAAILALLREGPRNGYQIMAEIEERSGGAWRPSPGAVYPALSQLADEGLIEPDESGSKRMFRLTDAGLEYVAENPEMARGAWERTDQQEAWQVPALFAEAGRLGSGIMQLARAGSPDQIRAAERLLEKTRRELYRILADDAAPADETDDEDDADDADDEQDL